MVVKKFPQTLTEARLPTNSEINLQGYSRSYLRGSLGGSLRDSPEAIPPPEAEFDIRH